jgi:uncharacterized protein YrzB (UPF0473 family)
MTHHTFKHDDIDNVYYDINLFNPYQATQEIDAIYSETRNKAIVTGRGDDYYLTVTKFEIPSTTIPIFYFQLSGVDDTEGIYSVTLEYNGTFIQQPLIFVPQGGEPLSINSYSQFIDIINTALETAFTDLQTAEPGIPVTDPPFLIYDSVTNLISIKVDKDYADPGNETSLFFNWELYSFFQTWEIILNSQGSSPNGTDVQILIKDNNNNTDPSDPAFFLIPQELSSLQLWYDIRKIVITTNSIPIQKEYISSIDENGNQVFLPILTDFTPGLNNIDESLTNYIYFPSGPYRLIDINSDQDIRKIDIQVYWEDKYRNLRLLRIPPGQGLSIQLLFLRKTQLNMQNAL